MNIYASYELAKFEDRQTNASVKLEEVGSKLWNSFYSITEAGVGQKLKDFTSLKKAHTEWLELTEKYYDITEELRNYFYSSGVKEKDYEKLEKSFNTLTSFLKERLEKMKNEKKK